MMIHGGFCQATYDFQHAGHLCADLTRRGSSIAILNMDELEIPEAVGPGTFQDVSLAAHTIPEILSSDPHVDITRMTVMGHSAGGHLALWMVSRHKVSKTSALHDDRKSPFTTAVSLAGVSDLRTAWNQRLGHGIVTRLFGGTPDEHLDRYDAGSPIELLPNKARQVLVHGSADVTVPISQSEQFARKAEQLGDECKLIKLEGVGHFEVIDPESSAWSNVVRAVRSTLDVNLSL